MQAHPLSSPAARITSPSPSASPKLALKAGPGASPHPSLPPPSRIPSGFYVGMTSGLVTDLGAALAMSKAKPATSTLLAAVPKTSSSLAEGAGLAHDAGNLLGALGLYCDLLQAPGVLRAEHRHYAVELRQLAERSGAMIQRLLTANLPEASKPVPTHCNPIVVLGEQEPLLAGVAAPWSSVVVAVQPGLTEAPVSQETLERITLNLVRNAAQAFQKQHEHKLAEAFSQGIIRVSFAQVERNVELQIDDDGPGLTPATAAAFLHPTPLPVGAARGLGHRIVHELVQKSGGKIAVRVRPGRGTSFTISWPVRQDSPHGGHGAGVADECFPISVSGLGRGGSSAC
jgi:nitrogen-specific signal transduction histidine kinase